LSRGKRRFTRIIVGARRNSTIATVTTARTSEFVSPVQTGRSFAADAGSVSDAQWASVVDPSGIWNV
jgi:hypothetical protein